MKKVFLSYLNNELRAKKSLLTRNTLSEEDKAVLTETIEALQTAIADAERVEETQSANSVLEQMRMEIENKLAALSEKIEETENSRLPKGGSSDYLSTNAALADFCRVIRNSNGKIENFRQGWNECLSANGVTTAGGSEEALLPAVVKGKITDAWDSPSNWLKRLNNSGAKRFMIRYNNSDQTAETSRAKGHKAGELKALQSIQMVQKEINAQFIYKIMDMSKQTEWNDDGALISYVTTELVNQILWEIERAVLVGDGRSAPMDSNPDYRIKSIEAIAREVSDTFVTVQNKTEDSLIEQLAMLVASIQSPSESVTLFMSKPTLLELRKVVFSATSTPQFISAADVASQIGCKDIITTSHVTQIYPVIAADLSGITTVGSINPELAHWEDFRTNSLFWRYECAFGAGLAKPKAFAVLYDNSR